MLLLLKRTFLDKNNSYLQKKYLRHQIDLYAFGTDVIQMQTKSNWNIPDSRNWVYETSIHYTDDMKFQSRIVFNIHNKRI